MNNRKSILLIHPPVAKPCEPPAGIAKLAGALRANGVHCGIFDASLEGLLYLLDNPAPAVDTWSRRAVTHLPKHLEELRTETLYAAGMDRYKRAVADVNRLLYMAGQPHGVQLSLSNYYDPKASPVLSRELVRAARNYADNPFFPFFKQRLSERFADQVPDIVGFSVNFMSQAVCAFAMAGFIKERYPEIRVVFGGGLVTSWMRIPDFDNPFEGIVDELVAGPGEGALLRMCGVESPRAGAGYDFTGFPTERYLAPGLILPYSASDGCYWRRCSFCPETAEQNAYRPHDPAKVLKDIERSASGTKPVLIHFVDNALSPRFMKYLIENPPGMPWYAFVRVTPHLADPAFVEGLAASGCVMLKIGIESGDPEVLAALDKGVDLETVSKALKVIQAASIAVYAYLLFGTPAETRDSAEKTRDFTLAHADAIDYLNLAIFNLPAHCQEAAHLDTAAFYDGDLSLYREFRHPAGWNRNRVRRFLTRDFKAYPAIRAIINSDPPYFTSNHAPLLKLFS